MTYTSEKIFKNIMRNSKKISSVVILAMMMVMMLMPMNSYAAVPKTTKITMSKTGKVLYKGQVYGLSVNKANKYVKVLSMKWSTSNKKVAIVSSKGNVKGVATGYANIYCKVTWTNKKTSTVKCLIKVINPVKLKTYTLSRTTLNLKPGSSASVVKKVTPSNATIAKYTYGTTNAKVATISQSGKVVAKGVGTCNVGCTIKTYDNKKYTRWCEVKVWVPVEKITVDDLELEKGTSKKITTKFTPSNSTYKTLAYASFDKNIATVDRSGVVTAVSAGTTNIVVRSVGDKRDYCKVTVKEKQDDEEDEKEDEEDDKKDDEEDKDEIVPTSLSLNKMSETCEIGYKFNLVATVLPEDATDKSVTYKTSNEKVAKVDELGVVEGVGIGKATITVSTSNGLKAECSVTVKETGYVINFVKTKEDVKLEASKYVEAIAVDKYGTKNNVVYTSSDEKIATVDKDGLVVGISKGTAIITAKLDPSIPQEGEGVSATCEITVSKPDASLMHTKEPYVSTYYFNPKPSCKEDIIIPIYVTDTDQKEYITKDYSKRFDLLVEVDGVKNYIRGLKAGDNEVNLGKLSEGNHYFALQSIDTDTGLKSHKLYNDLMVVNPDTYKISTSQTYRMTKEDLTKYGINNENSTDETVAIATKNGLNKLFVDIKASGYRKIVLLEGTYRIDCEKSREKAIEIPSYFTVDMNGSTFKLNTIKEGNVGAVLVKFRDTTDAHLTNGTLEGDRFERKDLGLETGYEGEPINTVIFNGCNNSSITNMTIKATTGHTVGTQYVWGPVTKISSYTKVDIVDGKEVTSETKSTSNIVELTKIKAWSDYVSVGNGEGYRGTKGLSQIIYVHFYDKDQNYMYTETGYQYRKMRIPTEAVYARVTMLGNLTLDDNVSFHSKHLGDYLEISNVDFYDTRTTAMAPSACNNLLIKDITYTRCGNSITPCAIDFEDGWQECQDVYYQDVEVLEDAGTATVIDNTGYNHVYENVKGHRMVIRRGVTGCVLRNYTDKAGNIRWTYGNSIVSKYNRLYNVKTGNICVDISESDMTRGAIDFKVRNCEITGSYLNSTYTKVTYENCVFPAFNGSNLTIKNSTIYPTSYLGDNLYFTDCTFKNLETVGGDIGFSFNALNATRVFDKCKFYGKTYLNNHNYYNSAVFNDCYFEDVYMKVGLSDEETAVAAKGKIEFNNCEMNSSADKFIEFGPFAYSVGYIDIGFNDCKLNLSGNAMMYMYGKPSGGAKVHFTNSNITVNTMKLIDGYGSIADKKDVALDVKFSNCILSNILDDSYKGTGNNVKVTYE